MALRTDQTASTSTFPDHALDHRDTNVQVNINTDDIAALKTKVAPAGGTLLQVLAKKSGTDWDLEWVTQSGGGGSGAWGGITGTLSDQTDLKAALDALTANDSYTNAVATPQTLGGIPAGTTFSGVSLSSVLDELLYPYQSPAFTAFAISGQATSVEVGTTISGTKSFTWSDTNSSNITASSLAIKQGGSSLATGLSITSPASVAVTSVTKTSPATQDWSVEATDSHSVVFARTFTVNWLWKTYVGTSASATLLEAGIEALTTSQLASSGLGTYAFAPGDYKYVCYPSTLPAASLFTDNLTGFDVTMATSSDDAAYSNTANGLSYALVSVTNVNSQTVTYRVYRTKNTLGGSITIRVT